MVSVGVAAGGWIMVHGGGLGLSVVGPRFAQGQEDIKMNDPWKGEITSYAWELESRAESILIPGNRKSIVFTFFTCGEATQVNKSSFFSFSSSSFSSSSQSSIFFAKLPFKRGCTRKFKIRSAGENLANLLPARKNSL